ncbi:glycogen debranching enzyme [Rhizobium azibense]|uniref:Glycogen debranching enzyme n=1 Tax=Rhizobium azibense TaxID=1136135 RepID=A0A4R3RDH2_9HYPH|nr:amylo-alpha-1,6-glucosidase [Rhizobium azibense]TCU29276.1 glycogen debranching enzyme [Rhizobium azibense]TCU37918.1 glycogen debranching enzyme [Rhizobium azibense]
MPVHGQELGSPAVRSGGPPVQFFIPAAASLHERRPRTLKHGDTFCVFDHNGDALSGPGSPEGLFHRDTRHLSHFYLTIGGQRPLLLSSSLREDNATLTCDLTNPDLYDQDRLAIAHDLIHIRRSQFLWQGSLHERITVHNFDDRLHRVSLQIAFAADFADLFEVRGTSRARRGRIDSPIMDRDTILLSYEGLDRKRRVSRIGFFPPPSELHEGTARFELDLQPQGTQTYFLRVDCNPQDETRTGLKPFFIAMRDARRALQSTSSRAASISSSNDIFNEIVRRSMSDLNMLITDTEQGPFPYAGIPWFSTVFGRDALITALQTLWLDPAIAKGVLKHLAANQATEFDPMADAEPGKILHEVRCGEMAELKEVPFRRYYGSVDATPLFVILAGEYFKRTGDLETIRGIWPNIHAALDWIIEHGDGDGDGFVEYGRQVHEGLINQGWKDSHDSVFHADGSLAAGPIALVEVQAYAYGAFMEAAELCQRLGERARAVSLTARAVALQKNFDIAFYDEELETYVLALDGSRCPCRVRSSNAGHVLLTGLAFPHRAEVVVRTLLGGPSFPGWGIRTVASTEARYNPMSYHNGSIWPHDNALIGIGMARYGFKQEAAKILEGLFAAASYIDLRRLPELICGFPRRRAQGPTFYPVACAPQAWAAVAPLSLLQSCLGILFDPIESQVTFNEPMLPAFLDEVVLRNLSVPKGKVDVAIRRSKKNVVVDVLERKGDIKVLTAAR